MSEAANAPAVLCYRLTARPDSSQRTSNRNRCFVLLIYLLKVASPKTTAKCALRDLTRRDAPYTCPRRPQRRAGVLHGVPRVEYGLAEEKARPAQGTVKCRLSLQLIARATLRAPSRSASALVRKSDIVRCIPGSCCGAGSGGTTGTAICRLLTGALLYCAGRPLFDLRLSRAG